MGAFDFFESSVKEMEKKRDVEWLIKALKHKDWHVREGAVKALGRIKDERAGEPLVEVLKDENMWVREAAATALIKIGKLAVEPLIKALKDKD